MDEMQHTYERIIGPIEDQMIRSIWRIVRNDQDAEDAMQNVLITAWKRWDRICQHPNPQALILKICIDAAYDVSRQRIRDQGKHTVLQQEPEDRVPDGERALLALAGYSISFGQTRSVERIRVYAQ